jgi:hypothetical protein
MKIKKGMLTRKEISEKYNVSLSTVAKHAKMFGIAGVRHKRKLYYSPDEVKRIATILAKKVVIKKGSLTRKQISKKHKIPLPTIANRIKALGIIGTSKKGVTLYYSPSQVEKIAAEPSGILASEAIEILKANGWPLSDNQLKIMLRSGIVNDTKLITNKTVRKRPRYDEAQLQSLVYVPQKKRLTITEKAKKLKVSRQTYYHYKKTNPEYLAEIEKQAGIGD